MRRSHVLVALVTLSILVAACGSARGPGGEEVAAGGGGEGEAGGEASCPMKVGASLSLTGEYARTAADVENAYRLWVKETNEAGGLLGCDVELTVLDDRSEPETGARLYERLITDEEVDLIIGPYSSAVSGAMMPIAERHQMVNIAPMASSDELFQQGFEWSFQVITPASHYLDGALDIMEEEGLTTIAYFGEDTAFPAALLAGLERVAPERGFEIVYSQLYPQGTTDFSAILSQIGAANPDAIFGGTYAQEAITSTGQMADLGVSAPVIALTVGAAENEYGEAVGKNAEGMLGASHWEPGLDTPGNAKFVEAYEGEYGQEPGYHAAGSYAGMKILETAVQECECTDQERIREEIIALDTETVFGEFDVDENGAQVAKAGVMIQWADGKKEIVWPFEIATMDYVVPHPDWGEL